MAHLPQWQAARLVGTRGHLATLPPATPSSRFSSTGQLWRSKDQNLGHKLSYLLLNHINRCDSFDMCVTPSVCFVKDGGERKRRQAIKFTLCGTILHVWKVR